MKQSTFRWFGTLVLFAALMAAWHLFKVHRGEPLLSAVGMKPARLTKETISQALEPYVQAGQDFPETLELPLNGRVERAHAAYSFDPDSQAMMEKLIRSYSPDYGAFVAVDAATGQILSLVSYTRQPSKLGNLALQAMFPAASVFKMVTAAAALDQNKATPNTVIAFNGANHTLYRKNVTSTVENRWTRRMTVREAFAKSVNTVFAKLGMFFTSPLELQAYARRFKFNEQIPSDIPIQRGTFTLPEGDDFAVAQFASGFNRWSQMSPLQGALMAASVANDGVMMEPYLIDSFTNDQGTLLYRSEPKPTSITMTPQTADELRTLMRATVESGTSRKSFRDLLRRRPYARLDVGGKSGSLTGEYPRGKCDWFVGYARDGARRIAVSALTINEKNWRVKSSYLARRFVEQYFRPTLMTPARLGNPARNVSSADAR